MKKTTKEHPITFFRKANEARQAVVKKSMKKAQDGIEVSEPVKINRELADPTQAQGSIYSKKGKKQGDTFYRKLEREMPNGTVNRSTQEQFIGADGSTIRGNAFTKLNAQGKPYTHDYKKGGSVKSKKK